MAIRRKDVKGHQYYYLEEAIRLEKPKVYSVFLGKRVPGKKQLAYAQRALSDKIYRNLLGSAERIYLTREQLIEAEKRRRRYAEKLRAIGKTARDEKDETDVVNFVYTTLTTEGVPITREDAGLAYNFVGGNVRNVRDENLRVALDMIRGLRRIKESEKGISQAFLLELHKLVMAEYGDKNPGEFRKKQAYIYLKSYEKAEEIRFRPPAYGEIRSKIAELVGWYNLNVGKLNAVELAALLHLRFYVIHPFADGNKRVSRLLLNKAFFDCGYPILNVSKDTRGYFEALIKSVEGKSEKPFVEFVFRQFLRFV
ncbi:Fic family protein [Candidatus Micrarchaeota archaeon]|nr:Fic family protein [Candidatus Micrarchaeota archaeon]